jgi:uncharacterized protein (DUF433 family)
MDWTGCSEVEQIPGKFSGVPILKGTRVQADAVIGNFEAGSSATDIAEVFHLDIKRVQAVLYYASRNSMIAHEEQSPEWCQKARGVWELPDVEEDEIDVSDIPEWTAAQWS